MSKIFRAIGLMSGTSLDGIDLALIETDGGDYIKLLNFDYLPYSDDFQNNIREVIFNPSSLHKIKLLEYEITKFHIQIVKNFLADNHIKSADIDVIGFHGQTIYHNPALQVSWQLGNSTLLAKETSIKVVGDLRLNDIAEGGQGAPLVPIYHYYLFKNIANPLMILNIGGVSNYTFIDKDLTNLRAADLCFGNAPFNDLMFSKFNLPFDKDGDLANQGKIINEEVDKILHHPIFNQLPPRSFSRNDFDDALKSINDHEASNILATYCEIFALLLQKEITQIIKKIPQKIIICGGGSYNKTLVSAIKNKLNNIEILTANQINYNNDSIEAEAFAFLAVRNLLRLPISFPNTTATKNSAGSLGGVLYHF